MTCPICKNTSPKHCIRLINVEEFIIKNKASSGQAQKALIDSQKDEEWLILPFESDINGFRGTRIYNADFWSTELFIGDNEERPELPLCL